MKIILIELMLLEHVLVVFPTDGLVGPPAFRMTNNSSPYMILGREGMGTQRGT